ncbi:MAG: LLM class F420-dependent oxidoreductase [Anaerolineales bacterium]
MKIGVVFPQTEFGNDAMAIRDYAQSAEALGFSHILAYDHVLGANPDRPGGWRGPYTYQTPFHEVFTLFSFMSAVTSRIGFVTGILILPQRQTALVAKQTAELDLLSKGRLRLGVAIGWNEVEYISLGEDFHRRGRRIEAQVPLLRRLWTEELVTIEDRWHQIPDAGINPLPVQRPIPIWFGGHADVVLQRAARLGDGWMLSYRSAADAAPALAKINQYLGENGRSQQEFGLEARLLFGEGDLDTLKKQAAEWQAAGMEYLSVNTMGSGFKTPQEHLQALKTFASEVGVEI